LQVAAPGSPFDLTGRGTFLVRRAGDDHPLGASLMDCELERLVPLWRSALVITGVVNRPPAGASDRADAWLLTDAQVCFVPTR
jgi:hypothetical protein